MTGSDRWRPWDGREVLSFTTFLNRVHSTVHAVQSPHIAAARIRGCGSAEFASSRGCGTPSDAQRREPCHPQNGAVARRRAVRARRTRPDSERGGRGADAACRTGVRGIAPRPLTQADNKQIRGPAWFALNGLAAPPPRGFRFDRSFLAIAVAADGLGVALESTLLAEREMASGRLVAPLARRSESIRYIGHH